MDTEVGRPRTSLSTPPLRVRRMPASTRPPLPLFEGICSAPPCSSVSGSKGGMV